MSHMSTIRMTPELIATIEIGAVVRVVEGGAPMGAKVVRAWIENGGAEGAPYTFCVEVDDGLDVDRVVVFERAEPLGRFMPESFDVPIRGEGEPYVPRVDRPMP